MIILFYFYSFKLYSGCWSAEVLARETLRVWTLLHVCQSRAQRYLVLWQSCCAHADDTISPFKSYWFSDFVDNADLVKDYQVAAVIAGLSVRCCYYIFIIGALNLILEAQCNFLFDLFIYLCIYYFLDIFVVHLFLSGVHRRHRKRRKFSHGSESANNVINL